MSEAEEKAVANLIVRLAAAELELEEMKITAALNHAKYLQQKESSDEHRKNHHAEYKKVMHCRAIIEDYYDIDQLKKLLKDLSEIKG